MEYVKSEAKHSKTAYSALTISGLSFLSAAIGIYIFPFLLSPIAMIISHLSKGRLKTRLFLAQAAIVVAIVAYILNCCKLGLAIYKYENDPATRNSVNADFKEAFGISPDEYTQKLSEEFSIIFPEMPGK